MIEKIENVLYQYYGFDFDPKSIILVGSNYNLENLKNRNSDIDVIVISNSNSQQLNVLHKDIRFDILILNENDILRLFPSAITGDYMASKILSSIKNYTILKKEKDLTEQFLLTLRKLYDLATKSFIPNNNLISAYLHNIQANSSDITKDTLSESFFAYQRLSHQLFEYISCLVYPFGIKGSYQGKVLHKYLPEYSFEQKETPVLIESLKQRFCPVINYHYVGIQYSQEIKQSIEKGDIKDFYFGYDNLINETTIVFVPHQTINKINVKFRRTNIENIVPGFIQDQLDLYTDLLKKISVDYKNQNIQNRILLIEKILIYFQSKGYGNYLINSLKTITILKSIYAVLQKELVISVPDFHEWVNDLSIKLPENNSYKLSNEYSVSLDNISENILKSISKKERTIKVTAVFYGIMKSLKLKIEDIPL